MSLKPNFYNIFPGLTHSGTWEWIEFPSHFLIDESVFYDLIFQKVFQIPVYTYKNIPLPHRIVFSWIFVGLKRRNLYLNLYQVLNVVHVWLNIKKVFYNVGNILSFSSFILNVILSTNQRNPLLYNKTLVHKLLVSLRTSLTWDVTVGQILIIYMVSSYVQFVKLLISH